MIATASFDGTVVIWESQNSSNSRWELVASLEGHENEVKCVCWSNDGKWIATCGRDKSVWIWENIGQGEFECVSFLINRISDY
jgi:cytosolic iron-sulfur protein assembly protein CIAO1